jgi:hypothetical protein
MIKKGTIFSVQFDPLDEPVEYIVIERLEEIGRGDGGWFCAPVAEADEVLTAGEEISPFDCWRVTDKYMEAQIQRGLIKILEN